MPAVVSAETQAKPDTALWLCEICEFVYDPTEGDPDGGIPPGTPFVDIPDDWVCPVCGAQKKEFRLLKPGEELPEEEF